MRDRYKQFFSWRLKLILIVGAVASLGLFGFSKYVEQIDDTFGALPMPLGIKARGINVDRYFQGKSVMSNSSEIQTVAGQSINRQPPLHMETAIFAYG